MDVTNFLVAFLAISPVLDTVDGGVSSPPDMEVCEGENFTIPWSYDDLDSDISNVVWKVNTTNIMTYFGGGGNRTPEGGYNVISANNEGSITVTSAERSNTGTYRIDISALTSSSDEVDALVCKSASSTVDSTKTGSVIQCTASDLGEPEAQLYIKVNGNAQSSSSATVKNTDRVECCISGCAVKCIDGNNEYCKNIQATTTTTSATTTTSTTTSTTTTMPSTTTTTLMTSITTTIIPATTTTTGRPSTRSMPPSTGSSLTSTSMSSSKSPSITTSSTTSDDGLSDEMILVIIIVPVGVLVVVGIVAFFCIFHHLRRRRRLSENHKSHRKGEHYKVNMRPLHQHQHKAKTAYGRHHAGEYNHKHQKGSQILHHEGHWYDLSNDNFYGNGVKQNPVYQGRNISRSYYSGSVPMYDCYRSQVTKGHVYPSHTIEYQYRPQTLRDIRRLGNPHHSYPVYSRQQQYVNPSSF